MNDDFKTLTDFLGRYGAEVAGRGMVQPEAAVAAALERFARGECEERERRDVCDMLRRQPTLLRWLADRVRMARSKS